MKLPIRRILLLAVPLAAAPFATSCVSDGYQRTSHYQPSSVGYVTYSTLPADYSGDAYYYNNRYYGGGRYEPGTFSYQGRTYNHRYIHDGQYLYGGDYRPSASIGSVRTTVRRSAPTYRTNVQRVLY